jgi:predicted RNA-binding protein (virulence factor B family)
MSVSIGKINNLLILKDAPPGFYLEGGVDGEILLPGRYIEQGMKPGDFIDVFIYLDSEDRLVATTEKPLAMVGDFTPLKVVSLNQRVGAFLNWGLSKDLLLPFREQLGMVRIGQIVVVAVYLDLKSNRIVASMRLEKHVKRQMPTYSPGECVEILVTSETPLGYNVIVDNLYLGLLYHSNLSGPLELGKRMPAYVHNIREDRKIDLRLDAAGYEKKVGSLKEEVYEALKRGGGRLEFDIKSDPQKIRQSFGVSKNAFKMAISALYKERRIKFESGGMTLIK